MYDHKWPKWVCNLWKKSSWYYFLSFREPLHVIWYFCTWWTRAPSTERRSLKSSTSSMNNCIPTNCPSNCFPNLDRHIHWHVSLTLRITEKNALKTEPGMGRQVDTGKGDPGNPLQTKRPPTHPKSRRNLNPPWDLLPLQRARSMWTWWGWTCLVLATLWCTAVSMATSWQGVLNTESARATALGQERCLYVEVQNLMSINVLSLHLKGTLSARMLGHLEQSEISWWAVRWSGSTDKKR